MSVCVRVCVGIAGLEKELIVLASQAFPRSNPKTKYTHKHICSREPYMRVQVASEAVSLCGSDAAILIVGGQQEPEQLLEHLLQSKADVIVCTADRLLTLLRLETEKNVGGVQNRILGNIRVMVMDEVCLCARTRAHTQSVCICIYVCMYMCVYMYVYVCAHVCIYVCVCVCVREYVRVRV
jgi:hypothetical protein